MKGKVKMEVANRMANTIRPYWADTGPAEQKSAEVHGAVFSPPAPSPWLWATFCWQILFLKYTMQTTEARNGIPSPQHLLLSFFVGFYLLFLTIFYFPTFCSTFCSLLYFIFPHVLPFVPCHILFSLMFYFFSLLSFILSHILFFNNFCCPRSRTFLLLEG